MHLHEGLSLFAVEWRFKNMAGIEHHSYAPTFNDALDCQARLHHVKGAICALWKIAKALLETGIASGRRRKLKAL
jgi:hypothetical protein